MLPPVTDFAMKSALDSEATSSAFGYGPLLCTEKFCRSIKEVKPNLTWGRRDPGSGWDREPGVGRRPAGGAGWVGKS